MKNVVTGNQLIEDANSLLEWVGLDSKTSSPLTEAMGRGKQKDWIIGNFKTGDLWCLALVYDPERAGWYLTEYVSYFGIPLKEYGKMYMVGMETMMDAMKNGDYEYCIAEHSFSKERYMAQPYWNNARDLTNGKDGKYSFPVGRIPVDPMEFEKMVRTLVPQYMFAGVAIN